MLYACVCVCVQIEATIMRQRLLHELREAWYQLLHWQLPSVDQLRSQTASTTLDLTGIARGRHGGGGGGAHRRSASAVASASSKLGTLTSDVSKLCERVLSRFVKRIARDASTRVHVVDTPHSRTASVISPSPAAPPRRDSAPLDPHSASLRLDSSQVFDQLEQILSFIGRALADETPVSSGQADSVAVRLGEQLIDDVFECVYTDCLSHIVQSSETSWPTLDKMLQLAERFQTNITRHLQLQVSHV